MKKLQTLFLLVSLTICAHSATVGGYCGLNGGTNAEWEFNNGTNILTISGSGYMETYIDVSDRPWHSYASQITQVMVSGVSDISSFAFAQMTKLHTVNISDVTEIGDNAFMGCTALNTIALPPTVTTIGNGAFRGCKGLMFISLPLQLTTIATEAFLGCNNLNNITLPANLTSIGNKAFKGCTSLSNITSYPVIAPSLAADAFDGITMSNITVSVPTCESVESYVADDTWNQTNLRGPDPMKVSTQSVNALYGSVIPTYTDEPIYCGGKLQVEAIPEEGYHFTSWSNGQTDNPLELFINQDISLIASFEINTYDVTFNFNGQTQTYQVQHGQTLTTAQQADVNSLAEANAPVGHLFKEWLNTDGYTIDSEIKKSTTFEAQYELKKFNITVKSSNDSWGEAGVTGEYEYGTTLTINATAYPGYEFVQWEEDGNEEPSRTFMVTEDATYTAVFKQKTHYVTFRYLDANEATVTTDTYPVLHGEDVSDEVMNAVNQLVNANMPVGKTFKEWSPQPTAITGDTYIDAVYELVKYTVTIVNEGTTVNTLEVEHGSAIAPAEFLTAIATIEVPVWADPTSLTWTPYNPLTTPEPVVSDLELTAQWKKKELKVFFIDNCPVNPEEKYETTVEYGDTPVPPSPWDHESDGYRFAGWADDFTNITTDNFEVHSIYQIIECQVFLHQDNTTSSASTTATVNWGQTIDLSGVSYPQKVGYTCIGWATTTTATAAEYTNADQPQVKQEKWHLYPVWSENTYTVRFYDEDKTTLVGVRSGVKHGSTVVPPAYTSSRTGFTFSCWRHMTTQDLIDFDSYPVEEDLEVYVVLKREIYKVNFLDCDGQQIGQTQEVEYEGAAVAPVIPQKEGYNINGWDGDYTYITSNINFTAVCQPKEFTVIFLDEDGLTHIIPDQIVKYGEDAVVPPATLLEKEGKTFVGWNPASTENIKANTTFIATYVVKTYPVRFIDHDGTLIGEVQTVEHGNPPTLPANPEWAGHNFIGWVADNTLSSLSKIVSETQFTAQYEEATFKVTFMVDGEVYAEKAVLYGQACPLPADPQKPGFDFVGWQGGNEVNLDKIVDHSVVNALFTRKIYTVTFLDYDNTELTTMQVYHDSTVQYRPQESVRPCYTFTGWNPDVEHNGVTGNTIVKAVYEKKTFRVTFTDINQEVIDMRIIDCGDYITPPTPPTVQGFEFVRWSEDLSQPVSADMEVQAIYQRIKLPVAFRDKDNNLIGNIQWVEYEQTAAAFEPDHNSPALQWQGHTFVGWTNNGASFDLQNTPITQATDLKAAYTINTYTITFVDWDGTEIESQQVEYLKNYYPLPADPTRDCYTFAGWNSTQYINVQADATITATYDIISYMVAFRAWDQLSANYKVLTDYIYPNVDCGGSVEAPDADYVETKAPMTGYHFAGWNMSEDYWKDVRQSAVIDAVYEINTYTVRFVDNDGNLIGSEQTVEHGSSASDPSVLTPELIPEVEGKHFVGWDSYEWTNVVKDLEIKAVYETNLYTVNFFYTDDYGVKQPLQTIVDVAHGNAVAEPTKAVVDPDAHFAIDTKVFYGWSDSTFLTAVTSDMNIEALYVDKYYTVTFIDAFTLPYVVKEVKTVEYKHGVAPYTFAGNEHYGYHFVGWSDSTFLTSVTQDMEVLGLWDINVYTVRFLNQLNEVLSEQQVEHGSFAVAPQAPEQDCYHFTGWDQSFDVVISDLTIRPLFAKEKYTVTFKNWDGQVLETPQKVECGESAIAPAAEPTKGADYIFTGWDTDFSHVYSDLTVIATFVGRYYEVRFVDYDGRLLYNSIVEYGERAVAPENPVRQGHTFAGWDPADFSHVVADMTITALYDINSYTVSFVDKNGNIVNDGLTTNPQSVVYNQSANAPTPPQIEGFTFTGWDKDYTHITTDITIQAQYTRTTYQVTFVDWNNTVLSTQEVVHGATAAAPTVPNRPGYTFSGWSDSYTNIKENKTIQAVYTANTYQVRFYDYDGTVIKTESVGYGQRPEAPNPPVHEGLIFQGWDNNFDFITQDLAVTATYQVIVYQVYFRDWNDKLLSVVNVAHGDAATPPEAPTRAEYTFIGWDLDFSNVTSMLTVHATYRKDICQVIFRDWDNAILSTQLINYGGAAEAPQVNGKEGHHFTGWDKDFSIVHEDMDIKAQYEINTYTVSGVSYNNLYCLVTPPLQTDIEHGQQVTLNAVVIDSDYEFYRWSNGVTTPQITITVTSDTVLTAYARHQSFTVVEMLDAVNLCPMDTFTFPSGKQVVITQETQLYDTVKFEYEEGVWCDSIYDAYVYLWEQPVMPSVVTLPQAVYSRPIRTDEATQAILNTINSTSNINTASIEQSWWEWTEDETYTKYEGDTIWTTDTLTMRFVIVTGCSDTLTTQDLIVPVLKPNADNCTECQESVAAVIVYDWMLMIDYNTLRSMGYQFTDENVKWYRVVGDLDNMDDDEANHDDEEVGTGLYYSSTASLEGTGIYYAIIYLPEQKQEVPCMGNIRSSLLEVVSQAPAPSRQISIHPTLVAPAQTITLSGMDETQTTTIQVFSTSGQLINTYRSEGQDRVDLTGASIEGTYIIMVKTNDSQTMVKYVVKQ